MEPFRIEIVVTEGGQVSTHLQSQGHSIKTAGLALDLAIEALKFERAELERCPVHARLLKSFQTDPR